MPVPVSINVSDSAAKTCCSSPVIVFHSDTYGGPSPLTKLSGLIPVAAELLGRRAATVSVLARHLRTAGLIATGGRGPGGAEMGPKDGTNLLIGVAGAVELKDAPLCVPLYRNLGVGPGRIHSKCPAWLEPLTECLFGDALDHLLARAAELTALPESWEMKPGKDLQRVFGVPEDRAGTVYARIELGRPVPTASIQLGRYVPLQADPDLKGSALGVHPCLQYWYEAPEKLRKANNWKSYVTQFGEADAEISVTVTERTLLTLGELVST